MCKKNDDVRRTSLGVHNLFVGSHDGKASDVRVQMGDP